MGSIEQPSEVKLPIIDFANWKEDSTPEQRQAIAKELAEACHNVGFVFIINHGVSPELLEEAFGWSKRLFDLKTGEKMLAPHPPGPTVHRGYSWPGLEKVSQVISSDEKVGEALRAVKDCKVCLLQSRRVRIMLICKRKAMKSEVRKTKNNRMFGSQTKYSPASENS
jgi:isopenicillin N synthase-like dioxygenase